MADEARITRIPWVHVATVLLLLPKLAESFDCLTCTYAVSANPLMDYDCVTDPNYGRLQSCSRPNFCKVIASFDAGKTYIRSAARGCYPIVAGLICDKPEGCCSLGAYPSCEQVCAEDKCNDINPESWLSFVEGNTALPRATTRGAPTTRATTETEDSEGSDESGSSDDEGSDVTTAATTTALIMVPNDLFRIFTSGCDACFDLIRFCSIFLMINLVTKLLLN